MAMGEVVASANLEVRVREPDGVDEDYDDECRAQLQGLEWRLRARVDDESDEARIRLFCLNIDQSTNTVYVARVRLKVVLPNGQIYTNQQMAAKNCFEGITYSWELDEEVMQDCKVSVHIDAYQPSAICRKSSCHVSEFSLQGLTFCLRVAGYSAPWNGVIVWHASMPVQSVSCWGVHPLVPQSARAICQVSLNIPAWARAFRFEQAALSQDQCLSAIVATYMVFEHPFNMLFHQSPDFVLLFVVDLVREQVHKRSYRFPEDMGDSVWGLAHTKLGWVVWGNWHFWTLGKQMQLILALDNGVRAQIATHNCLYGLNAVEGTFTCWSLDTEPPSARTYFVEPSVFGCRLLAQDESLFVIQRARVRCHLDYFLLGRVEFEQDTCSIKPVHLRRQGNLSKDNYVIDWPRLIVVSRGEEMDKVETQVVWLQAPTVRETATVAIQKQTSSSRTEKRAKEIVTIYSGGLPEEELQQLLRRLP